MAEKQVVIVKHRGCLHSCGNWLGLLLLLFGLIVYAVVNSIREENARIAEKQKAEAAQTEQAKETPGTVRPVSVRGNAVD